MAQVLFEKNTREVFWEEKDCTPLAEPGRELQIPLGGRNFLTD
jgi:hypothetical protein